MRCSCRKCGAYMTQYDGPGLGCVCPECGERCDACLGTKTVISRDDIISIKKDPFFQESFLSSRSDKDE